MAITGKEVGRIATSSAVLLLLGLVGILLVSSRGDGTSSASSDDSGGSTSLEILTPSPASSAHGDPAPRPTTSSSTAAGPRPAAGTPTAQPTSTTTLPYRVGPAAPTGSSPSARPTASPPAVVVVVPRPAATTTPSPTPSPSAPAGRVTLTSPLPPGCSEPGVACRYPDAPAAARLGDGPASLTVTSPSPGTLHVTASPGTGASPAGVGFVIRVCRCTGGGSGAVVLDVRMSSAPGAYLEFSPGTGAALRIWVQELNEAGLSKGAFQDVTTATPAPTTSSPAP